MQKKVDWKWKIDSKSRWFDWNLRELLDYKDLISRFVRRDLLANYHQTVLGPFWIVLQPLLTTLIYIIIFSRIIKIPTDGIPPVLFFMPGVIIWGYFSDCLSGTMYTFLKNAEIFSKVYFPRLSVPLSSIISHTFRMLIQFLLFAAIYLYYLYTTDSIKPGFFILLFPLLFLQTALFSFGAGLIISVMTAKYRDLEYALQFILRLYMFVTPVVYPMSLVPEKFKLIFWLNPLTSIIETFRISFYSNSTPPVGLIFINFLLTLLILFIGLTLFIRMEKRVIDYI